MIDIEKILDKAIEDDASDVHFVAENKPVLRIKRKLVPLLTMKDITPEDMNELYDYLIGGNVEKDEFFRNERKIDMSFKYRKIR